MKKDSKLSKVLHAEWQRAMWLWCAQLSIERGNFKGAMEAQLEFLYWTDEVVRLKETKQNEYWALRFAMFGEKWGK